VHLSPLWKKYNPFRSVTACVHVLIFMFFMIYPKLCNQILMVFFCKKFENGDSYLVADMDVKCHGNELVNSSILGHMTYPQLIDMASGFVVIYIIGVPVSFFLALYSTKDTHFLRTEKRDDLEDDRKLLLSWGDFQEMADFTNDIAARDASDKRFGPQHDGLSDVTSDVDEDASSLASVPVCQMPTGARRSSELMLTDSIEASATTIQCFVRMSLHRYRYAELASVARTQKVFGGLFLSYEPRYYWWEVLELFRKLLLTGLIIFIMPETPTQLAVGCLITLAFMVLYSYAQPYEDILDDVLQLFCQLAIFSNYFSGLLLMVKADGADQDEFHSFMLSMNLIPLGLGACFLLDFILVPALMQLAFIVKTYWQVYMKRRQLQRVEPTDAKIMPISATQEPVKGKTEKAAAEVVAQKAATWDH